MRLKLHRDEQEVSDVFFAAYVNYLGYPVMKCSDRNGGTWTFLVPTFDMQIMQDEFKNDETSMLVKPFVNSITHVQDFVVMAKQYCGEYLTDEWRTATRR
jgi:hypothetical protein